MVYQYKHKRGQTSLAYLMKYGWAILIIIVVLGAMFSLGMFSPEAWNQEITNTTETPEEFTYDCDDLLSEYKSASGCNQNKWLLLMRFKSCPLR